MAGIIDQFGKPVSSSGIARLKQDLAAPTIIGVRPPIAGHPADGLNPGRLASILRAADEGDSLRYQELAEDIEERDPHYAGVLAVRKQAVVQLPLTVQEASEDAEHRKHKEFIETWVARGILDDALFDILDGISKGYSVHEITWEVTTDGIVPAALTFRPQRWFEVNRLDGSSIMLRTMPQDGQQIPGLEPLLPHKFVQHRHPLKSGLLLRSGLARLASWAWMYKAFTQRDWAIFCQNYGMPIRVGRYGPDASMSDRDVLWRAVANIAGDCAAIIPKSMEVEFVQVNAASDGSKLYEARADWLDKQVSKAVLGQTATTDANPGSHAAGRTHRQVQEDIERADAKLLGTTIARQLFAPMIAMNFGQQDIYPKCHIGRPDEASLEDIVNAVQWMGPQGLTVKATELRERLNMADPEPDDEVVGGRVPPPAPLPDRPGDMDGAPLNRPAETDPPQQQPPEQQPPEDRPPEEGKPALHMALRQLLSRQTREVDPELVARLTDRVAEDAQAALYGLSLQVRHQFQQATDMRDLANRLAGLKLDGTEFAEAMQRGLALAELVGQASLLDEIGREAPQA